MQMHESYVAAALHFATQEPAICVSTQMTENAMCHSTVRVATLLIVGHDAETIPSCQKTGQRLNAQQPTLSPFQRKENDGHTAVPQMQMRMGKYETNLYQKPVSKAEKFLAR